MIFYRVQSGTKVDHTLSDRTVKFTGATPHPDYAPPLAEAELLVDYSQGDPIYHLPHVSVSSTNDSCKFAWQIGNAGILPSAVGVRRAINPFSWFTNRLDTEAPELLTPTEMPKEYLVIYGPIERFEPMVMFKGNPSISGNTLRYPLSEWVVTCENHKFGFASSTFFVEGEYCTPTIPSSIAERERIVRSRADKNRVTAMGDSPHNNHTSRRVLTAYRHSGIIFEFTTLQDAQVRRVLGVFVLSSAADWPTLGYRSEIGTAPPRLDETPRLHTMNWKYKEEATAVANYSSPSLDDSEWDNGAAGFGNAYTGTATPPRVVRTSIDSTKASGQTIWIRKKYTIDDPNTHGNLMLDLYLDETAKVYWNGAELPITGVVSKRGSCTIPNDRLTKGVNQLAVKVTNQTVPVIQHHYTITSEQMIGLLRTPVGFTSYITNRGTLTPNHKWGPDPRVNINAVSSYTFMGSNPPRYGVQIALNSGITDYTNWTKMILNGHTFNRTDAVTNVAIYSPLGGDLKVPAGSMVFTWTYNQIVLTAGVPAALIFE